MMCAAGVVDGEFLEVGEDGEGEFGGPGVAAELEGGGGFVFDVDGGFFGLDEEFAGAADAEAVVGGAGGVFGAEGVLVDDVLVGFGISGAIGDIPAEGFEEGIEELLAELGFIVYGGVVGFFVFAKAMDKILDDVGG